MEKKVRELLMYKSYFKEFYREQSPKVQNKIIKILDILENIECIPTKYLKHIESSSANCKTALRRISNKI